MRKKSIKLVIIASFFVLSTVVSASDNPTKVSTMPDNVKAAIEKSCFGCHNTDSRNEDAKKELDFKKLDELSIMKQIGAYSEIGKTIEKGEMPPKKFIEKYPDKKLTDEEKDLLLTWSKKEAEKLVKNK
jgi:hypothetical protein